MERVDGQGSHYRDVLRYLGRENLKSFVNVRVSVDLPEEVDVMNGLIQRVAEDSELDRDSRHIVNVRSNHGENLEVVSMPKGKLDNPFLTGSQDIEGLPPEGRAWVVEDSQR